MQARVTDAEDLLSTAGVKLVVLKPNRPGEAKMIQRLRRSKVRSLQFVVGKGRDELRLILPKEALEEGTGENRPEGT